MNLIHLCCQVTEAIARKDPAGFPKANAYFLELAAVDKASAISSPGGKQGRAAQNTEQPRPAYRHGGRTLQGE